MIGTVAGQEFCPSVRNLDTCTKKLNPDICSFFTGKDCDLETCQRFTLNACTACSDSAVNFFTNQACDAEKIFCDTHNRPDPSQCDLKDYEPVCGYYQEDCPFQICAIEAVNPCFSCMNQQIIYYKPGRCNLQDQVFSCDYLDCDSSLFDLYQPVCGVITDCTGDNCQSTFVNECAACAAQNISFYKEGICQEERIDCGDATERPVNCTAKPTTGSSVCAFFPDNFNELLFTTVESSCEACSDPSVMYYIPGDCANQNTNEQVYCLPNNRPKSCPFDNEEETVCGYYEVCEAESCFIELQNPCLACMNSEVVYYEYGSCKRYCSEDDNSFANSSIISPVCATYDFGSQVVPISLKNSQIACNNLGTYLEFYKEGLCPGDQGIRCEYEFQSSYGIFNPVCAVFQEGCNNTSCRDTYAEPMVACKSPDAILYTPDMCPEDQGVSCNPYRADGNNDLCNALGVSYGEVCGFSQKNCNDDSCMATFQNHCDACANNQIRFFIPGPCL